MQTDLWTYEITLPEMPDLTMFDVEATDGSIDSKKVYVRVTKDQIKSAPGFDEKTYMSKEYRDRIGTYYGMA